LCGGSLRMTSSPIRSCSTPSRKDAAVVWKLAAP
jgi:hypothetical protein